MRATFIPCSASGMAQPRMTSSISLRSSWGRRPRAPSIAVAAKSSGRVVASAPRPDLPTAVRTLLVITASLMLFPVLLYIPSGAKAHRLDCLVSEWFTGLEGEGNTLLGFALSAEGQKRLALKVEEILLPNEGASRNGTPA